MKKLFYMDLHAYISYLFSAYIFLRQRVQNKESNKTWFFKNIIVCWFVKLLCHFLTFLFHRVLWDLSVIPTEHTWRAKPIRTYMPLYTIFQFDDRHLFFILYIKIHAQYHSFLYVSFQSWFTWFWWLRIVTVTFDWSYRNKKKICTVFCEHSHFLSPLCCVCIYK